jgi:predicted metal-dependent hydrolase
MSLDIEAILDKYSQQITMELGSNAAYAIILVDPHKQTMSHSSNLQPEFQAKLFEECIRIVEETEPEIHVMHPESDKPS